MEIVQFIMVLALFIIIILPFGRYLYSVITGDASFVDPVMDKIDGFIYKICGIKREEMDWKTYAIALIVTNIIMCVVGAVILGIQGINFFNPNGIKSMNASLNYNTITSFITNTNLQHYSGESGLSYLSQMLVIIFMMFTSGATGLSIAGAFMRGFTRSKKTVGNFFVDLTRVITRILIPLSIVVSIVLICQGVPQSLSPNKKVTTIEGRVQNIALGPVAALESIKHLGTNGGGFFGANSSHPFENPTPFTNLVEMLSMMIIPGGLIFAFGHMCKNKKQAWALFTAVSILFLASLSVCYSAEKAGNPLIANMGINQSMGNMEGKEVRFGVAGSSIFTTVTTAFTTGSVNNMHDSLTPIGGLIPLWQMMLNTVFGGEGVGFMNIIMYAVLTVFLCGLMVGRTPEFLGKKIEAKEVKLVALVILIHPLIILIPSSIALISRVGVSSITNGGFHGLSQVLYEFTSSAANNGSGFEGLVDNTLFWNVSTGTVMLLGRYLSMIILLAVSASVSSKKLVPNSSSTFKTDNSMFTIMLIFIILIIGALTFLPAIALGPISEYLTMIKI
ncbi:potassium-transporting ATPase subunit KdpA [Hathewaya histolytica]|uniref:potassium-transporting ATPase subunit KdpA n=1 Tax=Hathewaya histolytica TaxID=1498 RepID=UPI003B671CBF